MNLTFGCELELPDVDTRVNLPPELAVWDYEDYTIVNSNGLAIDPKKKLNRFGSEVNMTPTSSAESLINNIKELYNIVQTKTNHKCNLHIHVGVEGLSENIELLRKLIRYTFIHEEYIMSKVDPLPIPHTDLMKKRIDHLKKSHQFVYPSSYKQRILQADTLDKIRDSFQPMKDGRRLTHLVKRCGINIRSLWDNGTIEFRHFFGTDNFEEYESAIKWCELYIENALTDQYDPDILLESRSWKFPRMAEWNEQLQLDWEYTNLEKNKRSVVMERLNEPRYKNLIRM